MLSKGMKARVTVLVLLVMMVAAVSAYAGSAVIGSVAGSLNASLGGQTLLPNTTIFSGDSLQVKDGAAVVAVGSGSRLVFGRETVASFLREANEVTVLLGRGNISLYHPEAGVGLRVKAGEVAILPAPGYKTLGEVAMVNGAVVVTAKEGLLRVESSGPAVDVGKGKTITVQPKLARSPQGGAAGAGSGAAGISTSTALQVGSVATGVTSAVLSGVAISRAGDARDAAAAADATAANAVDAANAAQETANSVGCALNDLADQGVIPTSPYEPPEGYSCP